MNMKTIIAFAVSLIIIGCGGINHIKQTNDLPVLADELQVGQNVLSRDTLPSVDYPVLTTQQRKDLAMQSGLDMPDSTRLIGVREAGKSCSLVAYQVPGDDDRGFFKVYLMTHREGGTVIDALDLHEFHTSEHQGPMRFGGNRFYTLDSSVTFDGKDHFTVHRVMTLTSIYLKDHTLTEGWRVEWDDNYKITSDGHFNFTDQKETYRTDGIDDPIIEEFKSRNLPSR